MNDSLRQNPAYRPTPSPSLPPFGVFFRAICDISIASVYCVFFLALSFCINWLGVIYFFIWTVFGSEVSPLIFFLLAK